MHTGALGLKGRWGGGQVQNVCAPAPQAPEALRLVSKACSEASAIWFGVSLETGMRGEVARRGEMETHFPSQLTRHIDFGFPAPPQMPRPVFFLPQSQCGSDLMMRVVPPQMLSLLIPTALVTSA